MSETITISKVAENKPRIVRLLTIGSSSVGKSSLLSRYTKDEFNTEYMPTIGIDFNLKTLDIEGEPVKAQCWDSPGQMRYRMATNNYYRGAHGIMVVYDVTDVNSYRSVREWVVDARSNSSDGIIMMLVANRCEDVANRVVSSEEGQDLASELSLPYFETSAKTGAGVAFAFDSLVRSIITAKPLPLVTLLAPSEVMHSEDYLTEDEQYQFYEALQNYSAVVSTTEAIVLACQSQVDASWASLQQVVTKHPSLAKMIPSAKVFYSCDR